MKENEKSTAGEIELEWLPCIICGSVDTKRVFSVTRSSPLSSTNGKIEFHYEQCLQCGLIYLNPRPSILQMRQQYPDSQLPRDAWPPNHLGLAYWYRDLFVKPVDKLPVAKEHALDYICRTGLFLKLLKEKYGWREVYGVDPRSAWLEEARHIANGVFCGHLEEAKFPENFFDLVTLRHGLEHLHNPVRAMEEVHRILKPGGFLRIEVPNVDSVGSRLFRGNWGGLFPPRHLYQFSPKTVTQLLEKNGFVVEDIACPPWPYYLAGSLTDMMKRSPKMGQWYKTITRSKVTRYPVEASLYLFLLPVSTIAALIKRGDEIIVTARVLKR